MSQLPLWRTIVFLFLTIVLLDAQSYIGSGSTVPLGGVTDEVCRSDKLNKVADSRNLCWYYTCVVNDDGDYKLLPRRCALGTHLSPNFTVHTRNPCTQTFPIKDMYDCTRPINATVPVCKNRPTCVNGGTMMQEDDYCWCNCPPKWQGSPNCSKATGPVRDPPLFVACTPLKWCEKATALLKMYPCKNGGTCVDQCTNFYCICPVPYTKTSNCEEFNCATTNFTCPNPSENCTRGLNGKDEFYVCRSNECANTLKQWLS